MTNVGPFGIETSEPYWPVFTDYVMDGGILRPTRDAEIKEYYSPMAWTELSSQHLKLFDFEVNMLSTSWNEIFTNSRSSFHIGSDSEQFSNIYKSFEGFIDDTVEDMLVNLRHNNDWRPKRFINHGRSKKASVAFEHYEQLLAWARQFGLPFITPNSDKDRYPKTHFDFSSRAWTKELITDTIRSHGLNYIQMIREQRKLSEFVFLSQLLKLLSENSLPIEIVRLIMNNIVLNIEVLFDISLFEDDFDSSSQRGDSSETEVCIQLIESCLAILAKEYVSPARFEFNFKNGENRITWNKVSPLTAFYFHLMATKSAPKMCLNHLCTNTFIPKRDDKRYCSVDCQRKAKNRANKARRALKKKVLSFFDEGKSLEQIAGLTNLSIEILTDLINNRKDD